MKRGSIFGTLLAIMSLSFTSAASFPVPNINLGSFFTGQSGENLMIIVIWMGLFFFLKDVANLKRFRPTGGVLAALISLGATYGIYTMSWQSIITEALSYALGDLFLPVILLVIFIITMFLSRKEDQYTGKKKLRFYPTFILLGIALIILSLIGVFYESGTGIVLGIIFLIIGFLLWKREVKKAKEEKDKYYGISSSSESPNRPGFWRKLKEQKENQFLSKQKDVFNRRQQRADIKRRARKIRKIAKRRERINQKKS